jgi:hypothetical protein
VEPHKSVRFLTWIGFFVLLIIAGLIAVLVHN